MLKKLLLCAALFMSIYQVSASAEPLVDTDDGPVSGIVKDRMHQFLGIPYAQKPVGDLRWRPPVRLKYHKEIYPAVKFGSQCAQNDDLGVFAKKGGSEDCLYLNVFRPAVNKSEKLPVLVWFHGGGLMVGSGNDYNPVDLVINHNIIVVTFNYRLGAFGFLSVPSLNADNTVSVNYGFMDQTFALDWVSRNISSFGGDPKNITIAGESSGAHSVFTQMIVPSAKGKFQHVIAMSGANIVNKHNKVAASISLEDATKLGTGLAQALKCDPLDAKCLRSRSTEEILKVQSPYIMRTQIIDGVYLREPYWQAFEKGHFAHVPLIHGSNLDEGDFFAGTAEQLMGRMISDEDYPALIKELTGDDAEAVLKEYSPDNYVNAAEAYSAVATDAIFACPALKLNQILSEQIPVYAYEFADRTAPSYLPVTSYGVGAAHTFEIPYLFRGFNGSSGKDTSLNSQQQKLAMVMQRIFTHPERVQNVLPVWKPFDKKSQNFMRFKLPKPDAARASFSKIHKCDFWTKLGLN